MKIIKLDSIALNISQEGGDVRIRSTNENLLVTNQTIDDITELITDDYKFVNSFFYSRVVNKSTEIIDFKDINEISMSIVLHYLYMYNSWRTNYRKQENKNLKFNEKNFTNPSTLDIVSQYFGKRYPNDWERKSAIILGMEIYDFQALVKNRQNFYSK